MDVEVDGGGARSRRLTLASAALLAAGGAAALALLVLDGLPALRWRFGLVLLGILAVLVGVALNRPERRRPWALLVAGLAASATGDVVVLTASAGGEVAANLPADAWLTALGGVLVLAAMTDVTLRVRGRDPGSVLDALLLAVAAWTLLWQLLVVPAATPGWAGSGTELAGGIQVLLFVAVFGLLLRTTQATPRQERTAVTLLAVALSAAIGAFLLGAVGEASDAVAHYGGPRAVLGAIATLAAGAAALHPSCRALDQRRSPASDTFTARRSLAVGAALLTPPAVLLIAEVRGTEVGTGTLALAWVILVPAVLARLHLLGASRDAARTAAVASDQRLRSLVAHTADLLLIVESGSRPRIRYGSPAALGLLGIPPEHLVGTSALDLHADDPAALRRFLTVETALPRTADLELGHRDGSLRWMELVADAYADAEGQAVVLTVRDISDRKRSEMRWVREAHHDALTGLMNRRGVEARLDDALGRLATQGGRFGVLLCDLDGFKAINDRGGHLVGDEVLQLVGGRFRGVLRGEDVVARFGGDEFLVVCNSASGRGSLEQVAARLIGALREPVVIDGVAWPLGVSIGMALADGSDVSPGRLLRRADVALYRAKAEGKGRALWDEAATSEVGRG